METEEYLARNRDVQDAYDNGDPEVDHVKGQLVPPCSFEVAEKFSSEINEAADICNVTESIDKCITKSSVVEETAMIEDTINVRFAVVKVIPLERCTKQLYNKNRNEKITVQKFERLQRDEAGQGVGLKTVAEQLHEDDLDGKIHEDAAEENVSSQTSVKQLHSDEEIPLAQLLKQPHPVDEMENVSLKTLADQLRGNVDDNMPLAQVSDKLMEGDAEENVSSKALAKESHRGGDLDEEIPLAQLLKRPRSVDEMESVSLKISERLRGGDLDENMPLAKVMKKLQVVDEGENVPLNMCVKQFSGGGVPYKKHALKELNKRAPRAFANSSGQNIPRKVKK